MRLEYIHGEQAATNTETAVTTKTSARRKKVMLVVGTRPEAIKMAPVVKEIERRGKSLSLKVLATSQHREMLRAVLKLFDIEPDYDLDLMRESQTLFDITEGVLRGMRGILAAERPDILLVHGDTTTASMSALAAFYLEIPVGHVEAGLRTYNIREPYPEEFNRQLIGSVSSLHFAPTEKARRNLLDEHKDPSKIHVTGNTAIDALNLTIRKNYLNEHLRWVGDDRLILLTCHRRENLGPNMRSIFSAIRKVTEERKDVKVIYPVHLNPKVKRAAHEILGNNDRIRLIEPLDVIDFHNFMKAAYLILTDSGGVQEEAPSLGKPVLVLRNVTERPEGIDAGTLKLVGVKEKDVYVGIKLLLDDSAEYTRMSNASNPYGDGKASIRIADVLERL